MGLQLPKRLRRVGLRTVAVLGLALLGGCSAADQTELKRLGQPLGATDRTNGIHELWIGSWIAAMAVGVLVWGLIGYACVRYRRRSDDEIPVQTRYNLPIEILYTVAPVVMVLVFFYYTVVAQNDVLAKVKKPDHSITVVGQQWSWTFNYVKDDGLDGKTTVYEAGTTADRPTLVLPLGESVEIKLISPDVAHSFWVPAFLFKLDVIPGQVNSLSFTPTREGTFIGRCAELCGVYHARMLFDVKVVSPDEYDANLRKLQQQGKVGLVRGGELVDQQSGLVNDVQDNDLVGNGGTR